MKHIRYISDNFYLRMDKELDAFDLFVDDIISSEENLLKGELDFLLMQYLFESLDLDNLNVLGKSKAFSLSFSFSEEKRGDNKMRINNPKVLIIINSI